MKKLLVITAFILFSGITFGQALENGNIIGLHNFSLNLDPDVTYNQYKIFFIEKYIPELDKNFPDVKHYFTRGNREDNGNNIGLIVIFKSQEIKNKYYNEDGSRTELMISIQERMKSTREKLDSLGTVTTKYTEWVIQ
jgi:hypothetical protein